VVTGGYYYINKNCIDLGFYRKVTPLAIRIPRDKYADQQLFSRMKIRQTNADITDIKASVDSAVSNFEYKKPINLKEQIVDETAPKLLELITNLTNDMKFEQLVKWYFKSIGASKVEIPSKNDSPTENGDADVVAYFENIKTAIMVQVKKHRDTTDDWAVQQIKGYEHNHNYGDYHTQMWVVSTCDQFSTIAINTAETYGVRLINGIDFCKMILDAGLEGLLL